MAHDRAWLLDGERRAARGDRVEALVTFWTWTEPTISLGFLQPDQAVEARGLPVVRRPTGGGAILHAEEWTYSALVPLDHPRLGGSLAAATGAIVGVIARALAQAFGIAVDPAAGEGAVGEPASAACFARRRGYELAVGGRKLMGSAQRRGRRVLLQQGSLLVGPGHERLARHLRDAPEGLEETLERSTVTLGALLGGGKPDAAPFGEALARAWEAAASDRGEAARGVLDRAGSHS
jgi:lipoate-protein ligase A